MATTTAGTAGAVGWPRTGWVLTGVRSALLTFDTVLKLARLTPPSTAPSLWATPAHLVAVIGVIELVCPGALPGCHRRVVLAPSS